MNINIITDREQLNILIEIAQDNPSFPSDEVIDEWLSQLAEKEQKNENTPKSLST